MPCAHCYHRVGDVVLVFEANGLDLAAVVVELRGYNFAIGNEFTVLPDFFKLDVIVIARTNVQDEVNVPGKDTGDVHDRPVRQAGLSGAFKQ